MSLVASAAQREGRRVLQTAEKYLPPTLPTVSRGKVLMFRQIGQCLLCAFKYENAKNPLMCRHRACTFVDLSVRSSRLLCGACCLVSVIAHGQVTSGTASMIEHFITGSPFRLSLGIAKLRVKIVILVGPRLFPSSL